MKRKTSLRKKALPAKRRTIPWGEIGATLGRWLRRQELWGLVLTVLGAMTLVALTSRDQGALSQAWSLALRRAFGLGAYPLAILLIAGGLFLMVRNALQTSWRPRWQAIIGWELVFFGFLGFIHILAKASPLTLAEEGKRGGFIGWALWRLTVPYLGKVPSAFLLFLVILGGVYLAAGIPWAKVVWGIRWAWAQIGIRWRARIVRRRLAERQITSSARAKAPARPTPRKEAQEPPVRTAPAAPLKEEASAMPPEEPPFLHAEAPPEALPPLTLLATDRSVESDEAEVRERARLIEETLAAFGIPAEVVEWNRGPVVTQFGVEPGYVERPDRDGAPRRQKVRVSQILALQNDLALALAAAPIRIEAPVPGRSLVGIEVPNEVKATVGLRGVMESPQFRQLRSPLRIALGRSVSGEPVVADLTAMPHLLIAGATGTGKSVCLNAILIALLCQNAPEQLRLLLIDPKRVEFAAYNGIPHLLSPVVVEPERVVSALKWVVREMERRYREFAQVGARNLAAYNRTVAKRQMKPLPMIVVVIDELADLMLAAPEEVERTICRIAQMARATGIHLVIATQRPSVDVVTGLIKANFPARISFAVSSQVDSRVVLDAPGAEKLLGRGDMLYMAPDSPRLQRIQGCFVSDQEVRNVVNFWRARAAQPREQPNAQQEIPPWETAEAEAEEDDELLQKAIALVRERRQASASFLQRHMRIGYPRAARLMDQLEKMGIVGPVEAGGRSRAVLDPQGKPLPPPEDEV